MLLHYYRPAAKMSCALMLLHASFNSVSAQADTALRLEWAVALDNDYFVFGIPPKHRSDDNYSHGVLARRVGSQPRTRWLRALCAPRDRCALVLEAGQQMYTPVNEAEVPIAGERPHAGWLYYYTGVRRFNATRSTEYGTTLGVTGPPSLAEAVQRAIHRAVPEFREPVGWEHQLPTELAFALSATHARTLLLGSRDRAALQITSSVRADAGTLRLAGGGSVNVQAGLGLHHPWLAEPAARAGLYLLGRVQQELIAHTLFLDGSTYRSSVRVEREPRVREVETGVGVRVANLLLEYSVSIRSREYAGGPTAHSVGRISLRWGDYY